MTEEEKIEKTNQVVANFKQRLSEIRAHQFEVMKRLVDKTDARKIAKIKEELNKNG